MDDKFRILKLDANTPERVYCELARLHCQQISQGFLTRLGPKFLRRLYRVIAASPDSFAIAAVCGSDVAGFVCGSTNAKRVYRSFLRTEAWRVMPLLLPALVRPASLRRMWETWRYPAQQIHRELPSAEILNFCVSADHQRQGIGKRLFDQLVAEFDSRQVSAIKIVTGDHQRSAQAFYEAVGARRVDRLEVHRGSESLVYVYSIATGRQSFGQPPGNQATAA